MTSSELERLIRQRLEAAKLLQVLDEFKSQFLEFPDGLFAELVLNDGSRLVDVERIGRELRESLRKQGVDLDVIVRAVWTVREVGDPQPARGASGGIRSAWAFPATLVSGGLTVDVEVDVDTFAIDAIRRRLLDRGAQGVDEKEVMKDVVQEFLKLQLSTGGESYWDPIRYPQPELRESTFAYLLGHSAVGKGQEERR
jgi:hypothetical protein